MRGTSKMSEPMEQRKPLVSVIIPAYKMGQFIGEALESVGAQTYPHWEVIVVDDAGPEDGTRGAVEAFATKYPDHRVEYIRHETNQGVSAARNAAIETAKGEFVAFLDPDDVWSKNYLAEICGHLANHPQVDLVYTSKIPIDEQSQEIGGVAKPTFEELKDFPQSLYYRNWINPSQAVCRRYSLPSPTFDVNLNHIEDWDLWLRMLWGGARFAYLDEPLSMYRRHASCATFAQTDIAYERAFRFWIKHCDKPEFAMALARQLRDVSIRLRYISEKRPSIPARVAGSARRFLKCFFGKVGQKLSIAI
jgi:glycosyltransferase involved in cell wall biosynthesis